MERTSPSAPMLPFGSLSTRLNLLLTGYTDDAIVRYDVRDAGVMFLQKPFSMATLARKVREVLAAGETAQ